jgi:pimeloyl-ACP methyl ester carboxylesterase
MKTSGLVAAIVGNLLCAALAVAPAAADAPKKTIVLVHGAWANGSSWDKVVPLLLAKGYKVVAVHEPLSSLVDDVAAVKRVVDAQPGDVVLVGHSYGGVIITEAGNDPKVTNLVYVAAFGPDANESINDLAKGAPTPDWQKTLQVIDGYAALSDEAVAHDFAQDLGRADQKLLAVTQGWTATKAFDGKVSTAAWKTKPSWFIVATNDRMIGRAPEEQMAKRMKAKTTSLASSHVVMLSKPREVAAVILDAASAPTTTSSNAAARE